MQCLFGFVLIVVFLGLFLFYCIDGFRSPCSRVKVFGQDFQVHQATNYIKYHIPLPIGSKGLILKKGCLREKVFLVGMGEGGGGGVISCQLV